MITAPVSPLSPAVREVLTAYRAAAHAEARLWRQTPEGWDLLFPDGSAAEVGPGATRAPVGGAESGICVEICGAAGDERPDTTARFVAAMVEHAMRHESEIRHISTELAERYEEITLLYSISETLGSIISLKGAADKILAEVTSVLGVRRASLWVYNRETEQLDLAAAVGDAGQSEPIEVADRCSVTAEVFRERRAVRLEPGDLYPRDDCVPFTSPRGFFLSVPVSYTPPNGEPRTVGVINLTGRGSDEPFSAGDLKLIAAIASQIGAALENGRLVSESLRQERWDRELELAHDLQLKLLPSLEQFDDYAEVAARCVPADSVGGDFYHLFRLTGGRMGVMIGDVSSHGFGAALIMALTMSAVGIHASEGDPPSEVLRRVHRALIEELETTEMYLTLFYGVIDPRAGTLTYTNAGHSHAFRVPASGAAERLSATSPPLGLVDLDRYDEAVAPWQTGADLLALFTDGLSEPLGTHEQDGERVLIQDIERSRTAPVPQLLDELFAFEHEDGSIPPDDRTAVLVRM